MDVAQKLAEHIANTGYENLPAEVVAVTKKFIMDSIGVGLAGSGVPGNGEVIELLKEAGGCAESRVFVYGLKLPAPAAAFANSLLIHSPDYDDTFDQTATHTNVTALPAAMALAERVHADGKQLITAVALGVDLTCRLALASHLFHGWHNTTTAGIFGATAASAKILGLDPQQTSNALGVAYSQAAGNRQGREDGAQTKRLQPAFATKAGVFSALLAEKGISGAHNIFQGQWGFFRLYRDYDKPYEPDRWADTLIEQLGARFEGIRLGAKPYPCVRCAHAPIDGALKIALENDFRPEDITGVTVLTNDRVIDTAGRPFVIRSNPEVDAKFSIPYAVAAALVGKRLTLDDFSEEMIRRPQVGALAGKVEVRVGAEFKDSTSTMGPIAIEVRLCDGRVLKERVELASGHPDNPMTDRAMLDKFNDCARHCARPFSSRKIEQLLAKLSALEKVDAIDEITALTKGGR